MPAVDVKVWLQVADSDLAMEVSEQVAEVIDANVVRPGVQLRGVTRERPQAACGQPCDGPRRLEGTITIDPSGEVWLCTAEGRQVGLLEFLREDGNNHVLGRRIAIEALPA